MGSEPSARIKFFTELAKLHTAAGSPGAKAIQAGVRATQKREVSDSTIGGWIKAPAGSAPVPRTGADLKAVVSYLIERAQQRNPRYRTRSLDSWEHLRAQADAEPRRASAPTAPTQPSPAVSRYLKQVQRFIAPLDGLRDRENDLDDLKQFCAGKEPYLWIRGEPWAGKSALLSTFVLDPPENVTTIGFFVTDRLANQSDHAAYTDALLEQLGAILPHHRADIAATNSHRDGLREELLDRAVEEAAAAGRRLVLVVDGLDEDTGNPATGMPSIAFHLPARPHPNLRVIVASRPAPPLPRDVGSDHPLHNSRHRRLSASPWARDIEVRAELELEKLINAGQTQRRVLALITTAKGLTANELQELTELSKTELNQLLLTGVRGRSFRTTTTSSTGHPQQLIYALAHKTLQDTAEAQLPARLLDACRAEFRSWTTRYRRLGWPTTTPDFLLTRLFDTLDLASDFPLAAELALDSQRHDRILAHTGDDLAALTEIRKLQQVICEQPDPDLLTTARLARHRDLLLHRNWAIPTDLPAVWARLGEVDHGEALARTLSDGPLKVWALIDLVSAVAETGDHIRAHGLATYAEEIAAGVIPDDNDPIGAISLLGRLFIAVSETGDHNHAESLARRLPEPRETVWALTKLVAATEDRDHARRLALDAEVLTRTLPHSSQIVALINLVTAFAAIGEVDHALRVAVDARALAYGFPDASLRRRALSRLVTAIGPTTRREDGHNLLGFARRLATEMEAVARDIPDAPQQDPVQADLVTSLAAIGDFENAETRARTLADAEVQARTFTKLVSALAAIGDTDNASRLAATAERLTSTLLDPQKHVSVLTGLVAAVGATADHDRTVRLATKAETIARTIPQPLQQFQALTALVTALSRIGDTDSARRLALTIAASIHPDFLDQFENGYDIARTLAKLVSSIVATTDSEEELAKAESLVRSLGDPELRQDTLIGLLTALAAAGQKDHARRLATEIETAARVVDDIEYRVGDLTSLVGVLVAVGERRHAHRLAAHTAAMIDSIPDSAIRYDLLTELDRFYGDGDPHKVAEYAAELALAALKLAIRDMDKDQVASLFGTQKTESRLRKLLVAGDFRTAEAIAESLPEPEDKARQLTELAIGVAKSGNLEEARRLVTDAETVARSVVHTDTRFDRLAELAAAIAVIGDVTEAEIVARTIPDTEKQASALASIAATTGISRPHAKRLLAHSWLLGPWSSSLKAAAVVAIDVLHALADEALHD